MALCVYSISDSKVFIFLIVFYLHKKLYCVVMFTKERKKTKNGKIILDSMCIMLILKNKLSNKP